MASCVGDMGIFHLMALTSMASVFNLWQLTAPCDHFFFPAVVDGPSIVLTYLDYLSALFISILPPLFFVRSTGSMWELKHSVTESEGWQSGFAKSELPEETVSVGFTRAQWPRGKVGRAPPSSFQTLTGLLTYTKRQGDEQRLKRIITALK